MSFIKKMEIDPKYEHEDWCDICRKEKLSAGVYVHYNNDDGDLIETHICARCVATIYNSFFDDNAPNEYVV